MANALYAKGKEKFLSGSIDLTTDTIKVVLVDAGVYTVNLSTDEFFNDIASVIATATLGTKTVTNGVFDAADATFSTVSGAQSEILVIYKDTGVASTSPLIAYFDTATGLPVTPNGGDITITWNASGIFAL